MRFMGTSRESSNMKSIMKSVIHQIERIFNKQQMDKEGEGEEGTDGKGADKEEKIEELREEFRKRLNEASGAIERE